MMMKNFLYGCMAAMLLSTGSCGKETTAPTGDPLVTSPVDSTKVPEVSMYLKSARETNNFIVANLLTPYKSYKVNTTTNTTSAFEWYTVSQIYADAAMVVNGDTSYLTSMNQTFEWMEHLWDKNDPKGGYFGFASLDGSGASGIKYVDDNSLSGMVYLEAYGIMCSLPTTMPLW